MSEPAWIDTTDALGTWLAGVGAGPLAIDTEADSFHHYREKVCLVQAAAGGRCAIIDPLDAADLAVLAVPLADPAIPKLMHGADYDVRLLHREFGIVVAGLFDTMIAARFAGESAVGLAALLAAHLGVRLDKAHQRADWSKRPLTPEMRRYAQEDVRHLEALAGILEQKLRELGRLAWVQEECERLITVRWSARRDEDPEPFRRVKGSAALPPRSLAIVRELWGWRDAVARRRDRPAFRVLHDETLVAIAKAPPATLADLARIEGVPESLVRSPSAADVVAAAQRGTACPEDALPAPPERSRKRLDPVLEAAMEPFRRSRDGAAAELGLDPSLIASRSVLEELARRAIAGDDPWSAPELRVWQVPFLRMARG